MNDTCNNPIVLDGPLGTALAARGVPLPPPLWTAHAVVHHPDAVEAVHRSYAEAGATVHTAGTFRTPRADAEGRATRRAVEICRRAVGSQRVFGSLGPVADCYRPSETPADTAPLHHRHAFHLVDAGCDGVLVETFAHEAEFAVAVRAAVCTGLEVWASISPGPDGDLLDLAQGERMLRNARASGASVLLVNCVAASRLGPWVDVLEQLGGPWGVFPNARMFDGPEDDVHAVLQGVLERQPTVIGGCCGTTDAHIRRLSRRVARSTRPRTRPS